MKFSRLVWGITWGSAIVLSTGALVYTFNPQPDPPGHYYGIMTVQPGQNLALHVANTRTAVDSFRAAQSLCSAQLRFVNACGQVLAQRTVRISPAEARSLNFTVPPGDPDFPPDPCADPPGDVLGDPPTESHPPDPGRQLSRVRAQVVFAGGGGHCVSSLEVGDPFVGDPTGLRAGGAFVHPGMIVGFNPQPDPPKVLR